MTRTLAAARARFAAVAATPEARLLAAVVALELFVVGSYVLLVPGAVTDVRYALYPFVWIDVGLWAVLRTSPPSGSPLARRLAGGLAVGYFLALALVTGLVGVSVDALPLAAVGAAGFLPLPDLAVAHASAHPTGLSVSMAAPGWGPRVAYVSHAFHLYFVPYRVVGYLSLAYLVYAAALDATRAAVPGVLGLATCLSCSFPLAAAVAGVAGGGAALTTAVSPVSVDLSTAAFVLAVALLSWRPSTGER